MDEYLKLKVECCEQQKQKWREMIKKMEEGGQPQHLINHRLEGMKDDLFEYYYKLMQSLEKIPDIYFVNDEFSRMFEKMVELARFNGNPSLESNIIRHFKVRDRNVTDWRSSMGTPALTMAIMGRGSADNEDLINYTISNWSALDIIRVLYFGKEVTEIEEAMCDGMEKLRGVYFHPNTTCKIIGAAAFQNCRSLKRIIIPDNVENLEEACFAHCNKMSQVVIGKKVETLGNLVFWRCDELNDIHIPDSVKYIGDECFKILHPGGLPTKLGLREITGMKNVEELGHSVFMGSNLTEIRLGSKLKRISYNCFSHTPLKTLTIEYNQSLMFDRNSASFSTFPNAFNNLNNLVTVNLRGGNPVKWIQKLKGQFTDCKEIHRLSVGWREQIAKIRARNDFKEDVSDEVIYIAYARILEQEAMQLMTGGETNVQVPTDVTRYISGFNPKRK